MGNTNALLRLILITFLAMQFSVWGKEKAQGAGQNTNEVPFFWCAKTDNNTHIGYCFEKQKECKEWSRKKFEQNGKKLHLCRPTRL